MSDCGKLKTRANNGSTGDVRRMQDKIVEMELVVDETLLDEEVDLLLSCCGCPDEDEIA